MEELERRSGPCLANGDGIYQFGEEREALWKKFVAEKYECWGVVRWWLNRKRYIGYGGKCFKWESLQLYVYSGQDFSPWVSVS